MMHFRSRIATVVLALGAGVGAAHADATMYATNHLGQYPDVVSDELIMFDPAQPDGYVTIGSLGVSGIGFGGLEFDGAGNLWGYASFYFATGGAASGLYAIDTETGAATMQGAADPTALQDLAWNPVDQQMYGINTTQLSISKLYTVDLVTGALTEVGQFTGLPTNNGLIGLAFDSTGTLWTYEQLGTTMYRGNAGSVLDLTPVYELDYVTVGSQGIAVDWSRDDRGYHGMIAQGVFPNYLSVVNPFMVDGSSYQLGDAFGENHPDGLPPVHPGDLAIRPAKNEPLPGDVDGDGLVGINDLIDLLAAWGPCAGCAADFDGNGAVDINDLVTLLANWS